MRDIFSLSAHFNIVFFYTRCPNIYTSIKKITQDLSKYTRGDVKQDNEVQIIQSIIGAGIGREELRDEIFVQCMRQATNNPSMESTERVWLLICLIIVAFQPSKLLYKVTAIFENTTFFELLFLLFIYFFFFLVFRQFFTEKFAI